MVICNREFQRFAFRHPEFVRYGESKGCISLHALSRVVISVKGNQVLNIATI